MSGRKRVLRRREKAAQFAASVLAGRMTSEADLPYGWSLAVFFERYMSHGASGTAKDFGPKKPKKLKVVRK